VIQSNTTTTITGKLKNYLTYVQNFGLHKITAMVGQETSESNYAYESVANTNLPDNTIRNPKLGSGTPQINSGFWECLQCIALYA